MAFDGTPLSIYGKCVIFSAIYSTYILLGCHLRSLLPLTNVTVKCATHTGRISLMWLFTNGPESCGCPWCQTRSRENELGDNRKRDKGLNMLPPTHPPTQLASTPCPHPQSLQTLPQSNHRPVSIAMSQLSSVIKFLAAPRMKGDRKGGKSCARELGGGKRAKCQNVVLASFGQLAFMQGQVRPAGGGMETCGQARLSPSWMQISLLLPER